MIYSVNQLTFIEEVHRTKTFMMLFLLKQSELLQERRFFYVISTIHLLSQWYSHDTTNNS